MNEVANLSANTVSRLSFKNCTSHCRQVPRARPEKARQGNAGIAAAGEFFGSLPPPGNGITSVTLKNGNPDETGGSTKPGINSQYIRQGQRVRNGFLVNDSYA